MSSLWTASRLKPAKKGDRGFDAYKRIKGRKRHILVDTLGLIHGLLVTEASIQDRDGAKLLLWKHSFSTLKVIWADTAYRGKLVGWVQENCGCLLETVKRPLRSNQFEVLPFRWIVERTFAWLTTARRLNRDYEYSTRSSHGMVLLAMLHKMLKRLAR